STSKVSVWFSVAPVRVSVPATDTDVDAGAQLTLVSVTGPPGKGVASVVDGKVRFEPGTDFDYLPPGGSETVVLTYVMRDEHGATSTANLVIQQIAGVNDAPVAVADLAGTGENQSVTVDVLANDTDVDMGPQFTLVSVSAPKGSASIVSGKVVFNPGTAFDHLPAGGSENVVLSYVMRDQFGATSASTVTVAVAGASDAASISGLSAGTVQEDGTLTATGNLTVTDVDSGQAHFQAPAAAALNGIYGVFTFHDGAWTYALNNGAANVQTLRGGQTVHDRLTVTSLDGTAVRDIEVAITGADDFRFAQLLQDFSFETGAAGWTNHGPGLEIIPNGYFGISGSDGKMLDTQATPGGITISQTVDVATGQRATLTFSVAAERSPGGLHPNSTLSFEFNGVVVKTITEADLAAYNQLRTFTVDVVGQAGADTLRIHDNGTGSVGYALDWVRLDGWILI
ncbi:VCBS domain-containing protein, partial [Phenylobacterium sp.]|uniref:VCBS domain-containing protein n=1 Tax=Phenylobacterium sp. TaxID=1871053 RepID=UPI0039831378